MNLELARVKAFYYAKVIELGSLQEASKLIQSRNEGGIWITLDSRMELKWIADFYRIKPNTVTHPGGEIPRPATVEEAEKAEEI